MLLPSGKYIITSKDGDNPPVGRLQAEDLSFLPKRIAVLPEGVQAPVWELHKLPNDNYILKIGGGCAANIDGLLYAILMEEPKATEWKLHWDERSGDKNAFLIAEAAGRGEGWVVPNNEPNTQIAVRLLIAGLSLPPFYPPNQVFIITPVN